MATEEEAAAAVAVPTMGAMAVRSVVLAMAAAPATRPPSTCLAYWVAASGLARLLSLRLTPPAVVPVAAAAVRAAEAAGLGAAVAATAAVQAVVLPAARHPSPRSLATRVATIAAAWCPPANHLTAGPASGQVRLLSRHSILLSVVPVEEEVEVAGVRAVAAWAEAWAGAAAVAAGLGAHRGAAAADCLSRALRDTGRQSGLTVNRSPVHRAAPPLPSLGRR
jgi:hypothetical protein